VCANNNRTAYIPGPAMNGHSVLTKTFNVRTNKIKTKKNVVLKRSDYVWRTNEQGRNYEI
jgi:hypothetical protein